jgi:hypothetical protein
LSYRYNNYHLFHSDYYGYYCHCYCYCKYAHCW